MLPERRSFTTSRLPPPTLVLPPPVPVSPERVPQDLQDTPISKSVPVPSANLVTLPEPMPLLDERFWPEYSRSTRSGPLRCPLPLLAFLMPYNMTTIPRCFANSPRQADRLSLHSRHLSNIPSRRDRLT